MKIFKKLKPKLKKLITLEFYEDLIIAVLKFLIKRNPISPLYAFWKTLFVAKEWKSYKTYFKKFNKQFWTKHPLISAFGSFVFLFLIIGGTFLAVFNRDSNEAKADWWDESWSYRKEISVTNSSGSVLTDFQTEVLIDTASLIAGGKMQSDCDDMRFTDINGNNISFWLDEGNPGCDDAATRVWLKVPTLQIGTNATKILFYYDNEVAESGSNGRDTFDFFDDFEDVTRSEGLWTAYNQGGTDVGEWTIASGYAQLQNGVGGAAAVGLVDYTAADDLIVEAKTMHVASKGAAMGLVSRADTNGNYYHQELDEGNLELYRFGSWGYNAMGGTASLSILADTWYTTYLSNLGTTITGYSYTHDAMHSTSDATLTSGKVGVNVYSQTARFDDFRVRKVASLMPSVSVSASEELSPAPVGYWAFDEGHGTTAYDASGKGNDGTISGASWKGEDDCVVGKCLEFDGSNDYVDLVGTATGGANPLEINDDFSISVWVNFAESKSSYLINNYQGTGTYDGKSVLLHADPSGSRITAEGHVDDDVNATTPLGNVLELGKWYHIVMSRNKGDTVKIYVNGKEDASISDVTTGSVLSNMDWVIGARAVNTSEENFKGKIDEVKIYPYARTEVQVKQDYNAGLSGVSAKKGAGISFGQKSDKWLNDGLVGYWKFDEADTSGGAEDSSGSGNDGTFYDSGDVTAGKFGNSYIGGGGSTDYVRTSTNDNLDNLDALTISFWANLTGNYYSTALIAKGTYYSGSHGLQLVTDGSTNSGVLMFRRHYSGSTLDVRTESGFLERGSWNLYTITTDGSDLASGVHIYKNGEEVSYNYTTDGSGTRDSDAIYDFTIGDTSNGDIWNYDGKMDEVRVYNRELSSDEVKKLYKYAPGPVAHWKMDEMNGTDIYDFSGNGNDGTLTGGPTWETVGKYGSALEFDGSDDYVQLGSIEAYADNFTVNGWIKTDGSNGGSGDSYHTMIHLTGAGGTSEEIVHSLGVRNDGGGVRFVNDYGVSVYATSLPTDYEITNWNHLAVSINNDTQKADVYLNGVLVGSDTSFSAPNIPMAGSGTSNIIGARLLTQEITNGFIDDVKIYNYARTQEQILEDMSGGKLANKSPILHLKLDEGGGAIANDSGVFGNDGTLINSPTWLRNGVFGKALEFDGSSEYISISDDSSLVFDDQLTVSTWVYVPESHPQYAIPVGKNNVDGSHSAPYFEYSLQLIDYGHPAFFVATGDPAGSYDRAEYTTDLELNSWHLLTGTYDGEYARIFVDGEEKASESATGTISNLAGSLRIGANGAPGEFFKGKVDDVKIHNFVLSDEDIKKEYQNRISGTEISGGNAFSMGGPSENSIQLKSQDGLLGYWKMDESAWSGVAGEVIDSSGNGNNGTITGGATTTTGRFGRAGDFDATDNSVNTGALMSGDFTVSAWVLSNGGSYQYVMSDTASEWFWSLSYSGGIGFYNGTYWTTPISAGVNDGNWHMVACTGDGKYIRCYADGELRSSDERVNPDPTTAVQIGRRSTAYHFDGKIDEARVYNRALSGREIRDLYLKSAHPVLHLKLDEMTGTSAYDSSGNNFTGTLTDGPTWNPVGKIGSAVDFDGATNYISVPDTDELDFRNNFSMCAWAYWDSVGGPNEAIIAKAGAYKIDTISGGELRFTTLGRLDYVSSYVPTTEQWHRVCSVMDEDNDLDLFVDGDLIFERSGTSPANTSSSNLHIGAYTGFFDGKIDDVKVYDYALSPREIAYDLNGGKPASHWKMDKGEGLMIYDHGSNELDGTMNNMDSATDWVTGKFNKALTFDDTNDYVAFTSDPTAGLSEVTVSAWVKFDNAGGSKNIVGAWNSDSDMSTLLFTSSGNNAYWRIRTAVATRTVYSSTEVQDDQWHHVVGWYNGSIMRIFIDGKEEGSPSTLTGKILSSTYDYEMGRYDQNDDTIPNGLIDDVRIYSYALTEDEIRNVYNGGAAMRFE